MRNLVDKRLYEKNGELALHFCVKIFVHIVML